jgi:hypothetical protein
MNDKTLGIIILVAAIVLLGLTFYVNVTDALSFWDDPLVGEGFGTLCHSEEECRTFCHNNRGRCNEYCNENPTNELCDTIFGDAG